MSALNDWFWTKGPVYVRTCSRYPLRRELIASEMSRIGVSFIESFDDGSVMPNIEHRDKKNFEGTRAEVSCAITILKWVKSNDKSDGVWLIEDDAAFLRDVDLLTSLCVSLTNGMGYMRGICLGSRPYTDSVFGTREIFLSTKSYVKTDGVDGFSWGLAYYMAGDTCRYLPRAVAERYAYIVSDGKMSEIRKSKFKHHSDKAFSIIHSQKGIPVCVPSTRLCVQCVDGVGAEKGRSPGYRLINPNELRLDPECPGCFNTDMYNMNRESRN